MASNAGDYLRERLIEWGVTTIYGFPGDGINGILGGLRRHQDGLRFVQTRHEEMAAFMACGHAKYTGEVGVCMATSGPGAIHLLNGLYDAKLDHQPVVAIVGQTFVRALGGSFQQEVKLLQLYSDVASAYCEQANTPGSVRHILDRALRTAMAERTVTAVIIPADVQDMDAVPEQPKATHTVHSGLGFWPGRQVPAEQDLQKAADLLNAGERVAMLVGAGALHATDEVVAVADTLGAGIAKALLGKAAVPDDVPFCTGSIGLLGTKPSWDMMQDADTLLMVGSSFPYSEFMPTEGQAKGIQIDLSGQTSWCRAPARPRAGSPTSCGCTRRRRPRSPPSSSTRPTPPAASPAGSPSRPSRRCRSAGPSTAWPTGTGAARCASTCATITTGPPWACSTNCSRSRRTGSPSPARPTRTGSRSSGWTTRCATTTRPTSSTPPRSSPASILHAAGAQDVLTIHRYAHLIGGTRMGSSPENSVVDANQRTWAVPNLFLAYGSVCPPQGSANPALTIMAMSSRLAVRMAGGAAMDDDPAARAGAGSGRRPAPARHGQEQHQANAARS